MDPVSFSNNLYLTCKNNSKIKEDGTALSLFDRIGDFFRGKHGYDHFVSVCKNASDDACLKKIKSLPKNEQLEIVVRIRQIQKKSAIPLQKSNEILTLKRLKRGFYRKT